MSSRVALALVALCAAALAACSSSGNAAQLVRHSAAPCTPPPGGRCAGPEAVGVALYGDLAVSRDGRTITGRFQCGGHLEVDETDRTVTLTFIAASVARGAMACALVPLFAHLDAPIGSRTLVDGVNGQRLHFIHEPHPVK